MIGKLKAPCPWCGMEVTAVDKGDGMICYVCPPNSSCHGSKLLVVFFGTVEDAVKAWDNQVLLCTKPKDTMCHAHSGPLCMNSVRC